MYDLIIVGAGPIGLYASTLARLHGLSGLVLESLPQPGGQLTELYPEKEIRDLPGRAPLPARDFIASLLSQRDEDPSPLPIILEERFESFTEVEGGLEIRTDRSVYLTKYLLLATGIGVFTPRKIGLDNEGSFTNIHYSVSDKNIFRGRKTVILGGGDSAVDWAINLTGVASEVALVHRRPDFRAQESSVAELGRRGVKVYKPYIVKGLEGSGERAEKLLIDGTSDGSTTALHFDELLVSYGTVSTPFKLPLASTGAALTVDGEGRTSNVRIFAVGDAASHPGKVKNITAGFGEAVTAVVTVDRELHPNKVARIHF